MASSLQDIGARSAPLFLSSASSSSDDDSTDNQLRKMEEKLRLQRQQQADAEESSTTTTSSSSSGSNAEEKEGPLTGRSKQTQDKSPPSSSSVSSPSSSSSSDRDDEDSPTKTLHGAQEQEQRVTAPRPLHAVDTNTLSMTNRPFPVIVKTEKGLNKTQHVHSEREAATRVHVDTSTLSMTNRPFPVIVKTEKDVNKKQQDTNMLSMTNRPFPVLVKTEKKQGHSDMPPKGEGKDNVAPTAAAMITGTSATTAPQTNSFSTPLASKASKVATEYELSQRNFVGNTSMNMAPSKVRKVVVNPYKTTPSTTPRSITKVLGHHHQANNSNKRDNDKVTKVASPHFVSQQTQTSTENKSPAGAPASCGTSTSAATLHQTKGVTKHSDATTSEIEKSSTENKRNEGRDNQEDSFGGGFQVLGMDDSDDDDEGNGRVTNNCPDATQKSATKTSRFFASKMHPKAPLPPWRGVTSPSDSLSSSSMETPRPPSPEPSSIADVKNIQNDTPDSQAEKPARDESGDKMGDFKESTDEIKATEIHPSLYTPPPYEPRPDPIVHRFDLGNRPTRMRQQLPVSKAFPSPVNLFWKSKFETFNHLQSEVVDVLSLSNDHFLISSPTGSGKSTIFEIAMARLLLQDLQCLPNRSSIQHRHLPQQVTKRQKMVYVAPSKALCEERYNDWNSRLSSLKLGIEVAMITGDAEPGEAYRDLASANLIVTTPEKFDSLSRRWTENFYLFASIKLFMVDEVHLLGDSSRGWCLETIICRMKTIQRAAINVKVSEFELLSSRYVR